MYAGELELFPNGEPVGPPPRAIGPVDVEPTFRGHTSADADGTGNPDMIFFLSKNA
jgi:hypothetical protein